MPAVLFCAVVSAVGFKICIARLFYPVFLPAGFSVACAVLAIAFSVVGFFSGSAFPGVLLFYFALALFHCAKPGHNPDPAAPE